jgi:hypothetical protein
VVVLSVLFIAFGLFWLIPMTRNWYWERSASRAKRRGEPDMAERTPAWDRDKVIGGVAFIVLGFMLMFVLWFLNLPGAT